MEGGDTGGAQDETFLFEHVLGLSCQLSSIRLY